MKGRGEVILSDELVYRPKTVSHSSMQECMMTSSLSTAIAMMSSCALLFNAIQSSLKFSVPTDKFSAHINTS